MNPDSSSHFEKSVLDELFPADDSKSAESFSDFLKLFDESCARSLEKLSAAVSAADFEQILAVAHNLKGTAGNIGSVQISEICKKMESAGKLKFLEEVGNLDLDLRKEIIRVRKALEDYGRGLAGPSSKS